MAFIDGFLMRTLPTSPALRRVVLLLLAAVAGAGVGGPGAMAGAREVLPGPVVGRVIEVIDGDTLMVRARIWVGQDIEIRVRLNGIDAPELRGRCAGERALAREARAHLKARVGAAPVQLLMIHHGKFAGRVLARVENAAGEDLAQSMLAAGFARPYDGGKRATWCGKPD